MYEIILYEDARGNCPIEALINELDGRAAKDKNARVALKQVRTYIDILERLGTRAGEPYTKHITGDIWELRPGKNRILFFGWTGKRIILLHWFRKKTRKTPTKEIEKAKNEMNEWIMAHGQE
ncbi:MAG: type II toxin-antitoxin system RelE/ParE family toxin [Clostridia bacterium]|nr:type II toxin-antitoxin system RelE/ParE family toxin [Clostridia bacterium]